MTQKQIRSQRKVVEAKLRELRLEGSRLRDYLVDLRKQCAHSERTDLQYYNHEKFKKAERCDDCGERFYYR